MGEAPLERYEKLGIGESLPRIYKYPIACRELSFILRGAYSKLPKSLQSLIFQHTLTAFRLLPQHDIAYMDGSQSAKMQTQTAVSAANLLIQSAEAVLPKQKRVLALTEFKHAKVAHRRRFKGQHTQEEGSTQLPQDVLVHIFSFLDLQSLLSAASVCWLWNSATSDNHLWHLQHATYFGDSTKRLKGRGLQRHEMIEIEECIPEPKDFHTGTSSDWKDTFKRDYKGNSSKKLISYRGYCGHCNAVVWLSNMKCPNQHCRLNSKNQKIKPISSEQIVEYILYGALFVMSSSESDSDSDDGSIGKLWARPRHLIRFQ